MDTIDVESLEREFFSVLSYDKDDLLVLSNDEKEMAWERSATDATSSRNMGCQVIDYEDNSMPKSGEETEALVSADDDHNEKNGSHNEDMAVSATAQKRNQYVDSCIITNDPEAFDSLKIADIVDLSTAEAVEYINYAQKKLVDLKERLVAVNMKSNAQKINFLRDTLSGLLESNSMDRNLERKLQKIILCLFYNSPGTEQLLNYLTFRITTVRDFVIDFNAGLSHDVINVVKAKLSGMPEDAKYCVMVLKGIELNPGVVYDYICDKIVGYHDVDVEKRQELAQTAVVIELRGIVQEWNEVVGYLFLSNKKRSTDLRNFTQDAVNTLHDNDLSVCCVVVEDQLMIQKSYDANEKDIEDNLLMKIKEQPIFIISDLKGLTGSLAMMILRCKSINYDFVHGGLVQDFLIKDEESQIPIAKKLADVRVNLLLKDECTQIFGHNVIAGISAYLRTNRITPSSSAENTLKILQSVRTVLSILRPDLLNDSTNEETHVFLYNDETLKKLKDCLTVLHTCPKILHDLRHSTLLFHNVITAMIIISSYLNKQGVNKYYPIRLSLCDTKSAFNKSYFEKEIIDECKELPPSPFQFKTVFGTYCLKSLLKKPNCAGDELGVFLSYNDRMNLISNMDIFKFDADLDPEYITNFQSIKFESVEEQELYIAAYLLNIIANIHKRKCRTFATYIKQASPINVTELFKFMNKYGIKNQIQKPTQHMILWVECMQAVFRKFVKDETRRDNFMEFISHMPRWNIPCSCFTREIYLKYFLVFKMKLIMQN